MNRISFFLTVSSGLLLAASLTSCRDQEPRSKRPNQELPAISVFNMRHQTVTDYGEWFGYLSGKKDTDIHPRVSGFLASQEYKDGQMVKAGDILFRIDPALFEAELAQAEANLKAAEASLTSAVASREQATLDVNRYERLVKTSAVSQKDLDDARQQLKMAQAAEDLAQANIEQMKAAVSNARINLDYTIIRAPYDGLVSAANCSLGDLVSPSTKLANIAAVNPIQVDFSINADSMIDNFRRYSQQDAQGHFLQPPPPFQIILEDGSIYPYPGTLVAMESKVSDSGLINLEGEVSNPGNILRAGMPVRVRIPIKEKETFLVPQNAIRQVLRSSFILIVDPQGIPHTIPVQLEGEYPVTIHEEGGYTTTQKLVAVRGINTPLEQTLQSYGYPTPDQALVVADDQNGVHAMNISTNNSRLAPDEKPQTIKTKPFSFRPILPAAMADAMNTEEKEDLQAKPTLPPVPVKTAPLLRQDVEVVNDWFGSLRGVEETEIRPKVSGFLLSQGFQDGAIVKKGDVLFTIDPSPYQAALQEAQANLSAAQASLEQSLAKLEMSRNDLNRYQRLMQTSPGAISEKTLTDAETLAKVNEAAMLKAQATVSQMEAAVRLAEINLSYTIIKAPFDGRIGIRKYSVGSLVSPENPEPLVLLSSVNPMRVDFHVSGKGALTGINAYHQDLQEGKTDKIPEFEILLEDGSIYPAKGHVITSDNSLSKSTGTLRIIGHVENVDGALRSGMPVKVRAGMEPQRGAWLVPVRAPLNAQGMDLIAMVAPDNAPLLLPITKGSIVNIPIKDAQGNSSLQPMQVIEPNRQIITAMVLVKTGARSLEDAVLHQANATDWQELLLHQVGVESARQLLEKQAGTPLPDTLPQQKGQADWDALLLHQSGVSTYRELVLKQAEAKDELDLIAQSQGCQDLMELVLKQLGFDNPAQAPVIVEGSLMAAQIYQANKAGHTRSNKVTPLPFHYTVPKTVVPSITAEPEKKNSVSPNQH